MGRLAIERSFVAEYEVSGHADTLGSLEQDNKPSVPSDAGSEQQPGPAIKNDGAKQRKLETKYIKHSIVSRHVPDTDLPLVAEEEVVSCDGIANARLWIVVDDIVLDCSEFKNRHPGGKGIIEGFGGQDCSWQWWMFHSQQVMEKYGRSLRVGRTSGVKNRHVKPEKRVTPLKVAGEQW